MDAGHLSGMLGIGVGNARDISGHAQVAGALVVVPRQGYATVGGAGPVGGHFVFRGDSIHEVMGMLMSNVLYAEVVNYKAERDRAGGVVKQTGSVFTLQVAMFGEMWD
jgi:hypothetical protein